MAPGGKTCIVRFEILATQHALLNDLTMQQQNAAVQQCRFLASHRLEIGVDLGAPFGSEGPGLWRERKIEPPDMKDRWRSFHRPRSFASKKRLGCAISSCAAMS